MKKVISTLALTAFMIGTVCGCGPAPPTAQQQSELNDSLAKAGFQAKYDSAGYGGIGLADPLDSELTGQTPEQISRVVRDFLDQNQITGFSSIGIQGPDEAVALNLPASVVPASEATPPGVSAGVSSRHYSNSQISFDYPSNLAVPDKSKFDIEKVRDMVRPSGVEILTVLMSADMNTAIEVGRRKSDISFNSLYEEKKSLADQINKGGINVYGEQYSRLMVEKTMLSGTVQALSELGEKANGEVAEVFEFLTEGYDYSVMFIYKNGGFAQSDSASRKKVVQSINAKSNE